MDVDELVLNCWIRSDNPEALFQVKISKTATVLDLQKAIKNETQIEVAAYILDLYKPKTALSEPFKEHLSKLILSEDGEFLEGVDELSDYFLESPPEDDIHVIVDAPPTIVCWLRGVNFKEWFQIAIQPGEGIDRLIPRIKDAQPQLRNVANHLIRLYKISGDEEELRECLNKTSGGERLEECILARNFLDVPVLDPLRVVIETGENQSPTRIQETTPHVDDMQEYKDIFLKVKDWGTVEESDIESNCIEEVEYVVIPPFVITFEQKLLQKPRLPLGLRIQAASDNPEQYFEPYQTLTAGDSQEEIRHADPSEVFLTSCIALPNWQLSWNDNDLKDIMASIFFDAFLFPANGRKTAGKDTSWPLDVVVKHDDPDDNDRRKYRPCSDFLITNSSLPRLLVEVNSPPPALLPRDLRRMLATGAFVVRFANNFVSTFKERKDFVLCTFYVSANGTATRYILFQIPNDETVYYRKKAFPLSGPLGRVEFARHLYNLRAELDQSEDQAAKDAVMKFCEEVRRSQMKSMYIKSETDRTESDDDDAADGGGGSGYTAQLRAHGYRVEPKVFVDDSGGEWESLSKTPDHILTVYRPTNPNKMFIAKKVREESNELEILKLLDANPLQSDHVISLVDSFDGWAIVPKMATVTDYIDFSRKAFESKVSQVCRGLIEGVAYLHKHHIAHRDIKPHNLVVDKNFNLKIIDFDISMRVKDEDEEVDGHYGTEGWVAPEVEKRVRHSPIKADRWSCGRVILFLLDVFGKQDISLRAFAGKLTAHDPKQRPSLLEWGRYLAPLSSDSGNVGNSDAGETSQRRRDRVDGDGEITMPPNAKKQRRD